MLYLTGSVPADPVVRERIIAAGVGVLLTPTRQESKLPWASRFTYWGADTGLFNDRIAATYCQETYFRKIDKLPRENSLFATAPDVFGDGRATLELALDVLPRIRALGFPAAFVAQPGVPEYPWDEFDVLFMGGPDGFKMPDASEGMRIFREAKRRGKWCHLGRCNSTMRYLWARERGYDSADGTHIKYCPTVNSLRVLSWVSAPRQLTLEDIA